MLQATAMKLTKHLCMKSTTTRTTTMTKRLMQEKNLVVEAQTAGDPQQNDVCEVCLVAAWSNSNSCKMLALSHGKPDGVAVVLTIRLDC